MSDIVFANRHQGRSGNSNSNKNIFDWFAFSAGKAGNSNDGSTARGNNTGPGGAARRIPPKFYRIGEVVEYSGLSRQTIHNYTTMGLLSESKWTRGGHRLYDESVFVRLDKIAELKAKNKSMREIRRYFSMIESQDK